MLLTAHKKGSTIIFTGDSYLSINKLNEIKSLITSNSLLTESPVSIFNPFFKSEEEKTLLTNYLLLPESLQLRISISSCITQDDTNFDLNSHILIKLFKLYNLDVKISDSLGNYLKKEQRRYNIEKLTYDLPTVKVDTSLFDRCSVGSILKCYKEITTKKGNSFKKGSSYIILGINDDLNSISIATEELDPSIETYTKSYEWSIFEDEISNYFTDEFENTTEFGKLPQELVDQNIKRLRAMNLPLYEHVIIDASAQALKRSVLNCYQMRVGKTANSIATSLLVGSKKIGIIATKNIRIFWEKEFKRLGISDYINVKKLSDLDKPGRYYLMTYNWLRATTDYNEDNRSKYKGYIHKVMQPGKGKAKNKDTLSVYQNLCPNCNEILVANEYFIKDNDKDPEYDTDKGNLIPGYRCINEKCNWTTDNSKCKGAAWYSKKKIKHKAGSYIDPYLAYHYKNCSDKDIKGTFCTNCKHSDTVKVKSVVKRIKKKFTMIIADEVHNAKDKNTLTAKALYQFDAKRRLSLTGTPMSTTIMDIYHPMQWTFKAGSPLFPYKGKHGYDTFESRFCRHIVLTKPAGYDPVTKKELTKTVKKRIPYLRNPNDFWNFTSNKIVRRNTNDELYQKSLIKAGQKVPSIHMKKFVSDMNLEQSYLTLQALKNFKDIYQNMVKEANSKNNELNTTTLFGNMSHLQRIATCPGYINDKLGSKVYNGVPAGGKQSHIISIVKDKVLKGEKVVLLSNYIYMQQTLEEVLKAYSPIRFQTHWDEEKRAEAFTDFLTNPKSNVFIAGTKAIKEGVDLSSADTLICCDLIWSTAAQSQAWSRILAPRDRERECEIYIMLSKNSLDEHIYNTFYANMSAASQAFDKKIVNKRASSIDIKQFILNILEDEAELSLQVRNFDDKELVLPDIDFAMLES